MWKQLSFRWRSPRGHPLDGAYTRMLPMAIDVTFLDRLKDTAHNQKQLSLRCWCWTGSWRRPSEVPKMASAKDNPSLNYYLHTGYCDDYFSPILSTWTMKMWHHNTKIDTSWLEEIYIKYFYNYLPGSLKVRSLLANKSEKSINVRKINFA